MSTPERPESTERLVSLREFEQRVGALADRIRSDIGHLQKTMEASFDARDKKFDAFLEGLRRELANLNELRREVTEDRGRLMTKEGDRKQIDTALDAISARVAEIEKQQLGLAERTADQKVTAQRVAALEASQIRREGEGLGQKLTWGKIVGVIAGVGGFVGIIAFFITYFSSN